MDYSRVSLHEKSLQFVYLCSAAWEKARKIVDINLRPMYVQCSCINDHNMYKTHPFITINGAGQYENKYQ